MRGTSAGDFGDGETWYEVRNLHPPRCARKWPGPEARTASVWPQGADNQQVPTQCAAGLFLYFEEPSICWGFGSGPDPASCDFPLRTMSLRPEIPKFPSRNSPAEIPPKFPHFVPCLSVPEIPEVPKFPKFPKFPPRFP